MLLPWLKVLKSGTGKDFETWFTLKRFAALLGLMILAAFPDVMLGSHTFYYRDFGAFGYPLAQFHHDCFWRGEAPLWNPLNNCGIPMLAQWNTLTLYPLSLFYLLVPLPWSLGYFCLGHLFFAGLTMYALAERWTGNRLAASVAGMAFALNGFTLHALMWPNNIAAWAWLPLVVLWTERAWREGGRHIFIAALIGAMQMLSGAPEIIVMTWVFTAIVLLGSLLFGDKQGKAPHPSPRPAPASRGEGEELKRDANRNSLSDPDPRANRGREKRLWLLRGAAVVLLVSGLSAAQLLPFWELLKHSHRDANYASNVWAMPVWGWANLLVPLFHETPAKVGVFSQEEQQWVSSYYMGIGTLLLAIWAVFFLRRRRVWLLAAATLFGLVMALGDHGYLYPLIRQVLPALGFVRFPIKFVLPALFALPLLAAFAIAQFEQTPVGEAHRNWRRALTIGGALAIFIALIIGAARAHPQIKEVWTDTLANGWSRAMILALALLLLLRLRPTAETRHGFRLRLAVILLFGIDALTHTPRQNPLVVTLAFEPNVAPINLSPKPGESRALVSRSVQAFMDRGGNPNALNYCLGDRRVMFANYNLIDGRPKVNGFYSLYLREQWAVMSLFYESTNAFPERLADFLGASQITSDNTLFLWNARPTALPLATIGQAPVFMDATNSLRVIGSPDFEPARQVLLPPEAKSRVTASAAPGSTVRITAFRNQEVELEASAKAPALVVLAQCDYPCWRAYVNGAPVEIWRANYAFQAVQAPAGWSQIRLVYEDQHFFLGAIVSSFTLLACVGGWIHFRRRASRANPAKVS